MNKPEDIPLDVWNAASAVTTAMPTAFGWRKITEKVARAIMAAKAEEREECAAVADGHAYVLRSNFDRSCALAVEGLAAAIRKRGEA